MRSSTQEFKPPLARMGKDTGSTYEKTSIEQGAEIIRWDNWRDWDNGTRWENNWENWGNWDNWGNWNNAGLHYKQSSSINDTSADQKVEITERNHTCMTTIRPKLSNIIILRRDEDTYGFALNRTNEVVFFMNKIAMDVVEHILDKDVEFVLKHHRKIAELLWISGNQNVKR